MHRLWVCVLLALLPMRSILAHDSITLISGETLHGEIIKCGEAQVVFVHPILGRLLIARDHVRQFAVNTEPRDTHHDDRATESSSEPSRSQSAGQTPAGSPLVQGPSAGVAPSSETSASESEWRSQFELGFNGAFAASEQLDLRLATRLVRETTDERTRIEADYLYGATDGRPRQNRASASVTQDWLVPESPWFSFMQGRAEVAQFQPWETRLNLAGGAGVTALANERAELKLRFGLNAKQEFGNQVADDRIQPEGLLGAELNWQLNGAHRLAATNTYYHELRDSDMFRIVSKAEWVIDLDSANGLNLKFGLENEYESDRVAAQPRNDVRVFGALVLKF